LTTNKKKGCGNLFTLYFGSDHCINIQLRLIWSSSRHC